MWNDVNNSDNQQSFDLIPNNTLAKVRMTINPGGHDDESQGWTGGYATKNQNSGSIYLSCEFVILEGEFAKRKVWSLIGLHSEKGPQWADMGRSFVKAILNSARGVSESDNSDKAQSARRINALVDLDGIEFVAKISTAKDQNGEDKNEIRFAIAPDHKDYAKIMGAVNVQQPAAQSAPVNTNTNRPAWAK